MPFRRGPFRTLQFEFPKRNSLQSGMMIILTTLSFLLLFVPVATSVDISATETLNMSTTHSNDAGEQFTEALPARLANLPSVLSRPRFSLTQASSQSDTREGRSALSTVVLLLVFGLTCLVLVMILRRYWYMVRVVMGESASKESAFLHPPSPSDTSAGSGESDESNELGEKFARSE